jgi:hypothetical protein
MHWYHSWSMQKLLLLVLYMITIMPRALLFMYAVWNVDMHMPKGSSSLVKPGNIHTFCSSNILASTSLRVLYWPSLRIHQNICFSFCQCPLIAREDFAACFNFFCLRTDLSIIFCRP